MAVRTYRVHDMHCVNCAMRIEGIEDDLPGIRRVVASYKNGRVTVDFDEAQVSEARIIAAVQEKGYTALPT